MQSLHRPKMLVSSECLLNGWANEWMKKWSERKPSLHVSVRVQSGKQQPYQLFYHKEFYLRSWLKRNWKAQGRQRQPLFYPSPCGSCHIQGWGPKEQVGVTRNSKRGGGAQALEGHLGGGELQGELQAAASGACRTVPPGQSPGLWGQASVSWCQSFWGDGMWLVLRMWRKIWNWN